MTQTIIPTGGPGGWPTGGAGGRQGTEWASTHGRADSGLGGGGERKTTPTIRLRKAQFRVSPFSMLAVVYIPVLQENYIR